MELSKALLGAMLLGIAVQTTSCTKGDDKKVKPSTTHQESTTVPNAEGNEPCPACGMG